MKNSLRFLFAAIAFAFAAGVASAQFRPAGPSGSGLLGPPGGFGGLPGGGLSTGFGGGLGNGGMTLTPPDHGSLLRLPQLPSLPMGGSGQSYDSNRRYETPPVQVVPRKSESTSHAAVPHPPPPPKAESGDDGGGDDDDDDDDGESLVSRCLRMLSEAWEWSLVHWGWVVVIVIALGVLFIMCN